MHIRIVTSRWKLLERQVDGSLWLLVPVALSHYIKKYMVRYMRLRSLNYRAAWADYDRTGTVIFHLIYLTLSLTSTSIVRGHHLAPLTIPFEI